MTKLVSILVWTIGGLLIANLANAETLQYQCALKERVGAIEADESFTMTIEDENISIRSSFLNLCTGRVTIQENRIVASAEITGTHCAADGFDLWIERSLLEGAEAGYVSVPTNDPSDLYSCTARK
jgi:hypothetical protein